MSQEGLSDSKKAILLRDLLYKSKGGYLLNVKNENHRQIKAMTKRMVQYFVSKNCAKICVYW